MPSNTELYSILTRFGDYYKLRLNFDIDGIVNELYEKFTWVQYNPRKNIDRKALSITSLDGGLSGVPDLDSLYEYVKETGHLVSELDFNKPTKVYPYFSRWLDPFVGYLGRTHIIMLNQGAYFPPHRDNKSDEIRSFRLFMSLNYNDQVFFMLEDKRLEFENGSMYFINTAKMHTLFNADEKPFYFIVSNIILSEECIKKILEYLPG